MEEKIRRSLILFLEILWTIIFYGMLNTAGIYKYFVAIIIGIFIFLINKKELYMCIADSYCLIPITAYCGIGFVLILYGCDITEWTFKTIGLWIIPAFIALSICLLYDTKREYMVDVQFYGCVFIYLFESLPSILKSGVGESTFAFAFGIFVLYYIHCHKWTKTSIAALLLYFANKRIAILAVVVCVLLMIFMKFVKYSKKWIKLIWSMLSVVCCLYIYCICSGMLIKICSYLGIDTTYRLDVYSQLAIHIPSGYYLGDGIGAANKMIIDYVDPWYAWAFENPHNDILKIFIELGSIGLIIFLISYLIVFKIAEKKITERALSQLFITFVYFILLMTTDNVSIYILFLVPMHSICLALAGDKKENDYENHAK